MAERNLKEKAKEKLNEVEKLQKRMKGKIPHQGAQAKAIRRVKHLLKKKLK